MPEISDEEYASLTSAKEKLATLEPEHETIKGQLSELQTKYSTTHADMTKAKTTAGLLEQQITEARTKATEWETKYKELEPKAARADQLAQQLTTNRKAQLLARGMSEEDIKDLSEDELATAEKLLGKIPGSAQQQQRYDSGSGGGGDRTNQRPFDMISSGIQNEWAKFAKNGS